MTHYGKRRVLSTLLLVMMLFSMVPDAFASAVKENETTEFSGSTFVQSVGPQAATVNITIKAKSGAQVPWHNLSGGVGPGYELLNSTRSSSSGGMVKIGNHSDQTSYYRDYQYLIYDYIDISGGTFASGDYIKQIRFSTNLANGAIGSGGTFSIAGDVEVHNPSGTTYNITVNSSAANFTVKQRQVRSSTWKQAADDYHAPPGGYEHLYYKPESYPLFGTVNKIGFEPVDAIINTGVAGAQLPVHGVDYAILLYTSTTGNTANKTLYNPPTPADGFQLPAIEYTYIMNVDGNKTGGVYKVERNNLDRYIHPWKDRPGAGTTTPPPTTPPTSPPGYITITVVIIGEGTTDPAGPTFQQVKSSDSITGAISLIPAKGWTFANITDNGKDVTSAVYNGGDGNKRYAFGRGQDRTLVVTFTKNNVDVKFDANGGKFDNGDSVKTSTVKNGANWSSITVPENPTHSDTNKYFAGWSPVVPTTGTVTSDTTFTAVYREKTALVLTSNSGSKVYDGTALTVSGYTSSISSLTIEGVSASKTGTNVADSGKVQFTQKEPVIKNGSYDVTHLYAVTYVEGDLTITKKPIKLSLPTTIPGTPLTQDDWRDIVISDPQVSAPMDAVNYTVTTTGTSGETYPNPGTYTVEIVPGSNPNYNVTVTGGTGTITVVEPEYLVTFDAGAGTFADGTKVKKIPIEVGDFWSGVKPADPTHDDSYFYRFTGWSPSVPSGRFKATDPVSFTARYARRIDITLTAKSGSKVYDGTALTVSGFDSSVAGLTITGVTATKSATNVADSGVVDFTEKNPVLTNAGGNDMTYMYAVLYETGTIEITKKPVTLSVPETIPGLPQTQEEWRNVIISDSTIAAPMDALDYTVQVTGNSGEVYPAPGTYTITIVPGTNPNYDITVKNGTMTINPENVTLTFLSEAGKFSDDSTSKDVVVAFGSLWTAVPVPANPTPNDANQYFAGWEPVVPTSGNVTAAQTFRAKYEDKLALTLTSNSGSKQYDGTPLEVSGYTSSDATLTITGVTATKSGTNVADSGKVPFTQKTPVIKNGSVDVTHMYAVTYAEGDLTITKKPVDLSLPAVISNIPQTQADWRNVVISNPTIAAPMDAVAYTVQTTGASGETYPAPGTYTVEIIPGTDAQNPNYTVTVSGGTRQMTINPDTVTLTFLAEAGKFSDDSTSKDVVVTFGSPWTGVSAPIPTPTNPDQYFAGWEPAVPATGNVTQDQTFRAKYENKLALTLTSNSDSKQYDGTVLVVNGYTSSIPTLTITGVVAMKSGTNVSDSGKVPFTQQAPVIKDGATDVTHMYKVAYVEGDLEITKKPVHLTLPDLAAEEYTGVPKTTAEWGVIATPGIAAPMAPVDYTVNAAGNDGETYPEAGFYTVTIVPGTNPNYLVTVGDAKQLEIIPAGGYQYTVTYLAGDYGKLNGNQDKVEFTVAKGKTLGEAAPAPSVTADADYHFTQWKPAYSASTVVNGNLTYTAEYVAIARASYTIEYYLQDPDAPTTWAKGFEQTRTGEVGQTATVTAEDLNLPQLSGYQENTTHADRVVSAKIAADGTTTLKVYFNCRTFEVSYAYAADSEYKGAALPGTQTMRYGQTVTIAANLMHATYKFTGWQTTDKDQDGSSIAGGAGATFKMPAGNVQFTGGFTTKDVLLVRAESRSVVYNGTTQTAGGYAVYSADGNAVLPGITLEGLTQGAVTASRRNVGTTDIRIDLSKVTRILDGGSDVTNDYVLMKEEGTLTVTPRPVKVWVDEDERDWGSPVEDKLSLEPENGERGIIAGDTIYLVGNKIQMINTDAASSAVFPEPGTYRPVIIPDDARNTNYIVEVINSEYRIKINPLDYTIEYYFQDLDLANYTQDTDRTKTAQGYGTVGPRAEDLTGIPDGFKLKGNPTITLPDETVLKLYFDRELYTVTYLAGDHGELSGTTSYTNVPYMADAVTLERPVPVATPHEDYYFTGWSPDPTVAKVNGNVTFTAQYVQIARATYTIRYYVQDSNIPASYNELTTQTRTGEVGKTATVTADDLNLAALAGYTQTTHPNALLSAVIKGDNTTELRVYFNCKTFDVSYAYAEDSEHKGVALPQKQTVRYGQTVTIAPNLTHGTFKFTGWQTDDKDVYGSSIVGGAGTTFAMPAGNVTFTGSFTTRQVLVVRANSLDTVYDGTTQTVSGYGLFDESGTAVTGLRLVGLAQTDVTASRRDVGTANVAVNLSQVTQIMRGAADVTEDYLLTKEDGTLKVSPRPVRVWVDADVRDWGAPVTDQLQIEPSNGDRGIVGNDTIHLKNDTIQMVNTDPASPATFPEPGTYRPVIILDDARNTNYIVEVIEGENRIVIRPIEYTIKYFFQNVDLAGYTENTGMRKTAQGFGTVGARPEDLAGIDEGFTFRQPEPTITLPGEKILELYFDRNIYTITYLPGANGTLSGTQEYKVPYGQPVVTGERPVPVATANDDYYFTGWSPDPQAATVQGDATFTAQYVQIARATYTVEYYTQNPDTPASYEKLTERTHTGEVGKTASITAEDLALPALSGYTEYAAHPNRVISAVIKADNTTVLRVYFNCKTFEVSYQYAPGSETTGVTLPQKQTVRYGQQVEIAPNLIHASYKFTGWQTDDKDYYGGSILGGAGASFKMPAASVTFLGGFTTRQVLNVRAESLETVYNGLTQTVVGYSLFDETGKAVPGITLVGLPQSAVTASRKDVGTANASVDLSKVTQVLRGTSDVTEDYLLTKEDGTLTITPRPVKIWVDEDTRAWGSPVTDQLQIEAENGDRGIVGNDTIHLVNDTIQMVNTDPTSDATFPEPGTYRPVIIPDEARNPNYIVEVVNTENTVTITPLPYTIEYHFQNETLDGYAEDTDMQKTAYGFGRVTPRAEDLADVDKGFTLVGSPSITLPDETVLKLYFDRNIYTVRYFEGEHGTLSGETTYQVAYGLPVVAADRPSPKVTPDDDYYYTGWQPNPQTSTVTGNMVFTAQYVAVVYATYKIEYYLQDVNDLLKYDLGFTAPRTAEAGATVSVTAEDLVSSLLTGFTENAAHPSRIVTAKVEADGSTALKVFFDRQSYRVSYEYTTDSEIKSVTLPAPQIVRYGQQVTIADNLAHGLYMFTGWQTNDKDYYGNYITGGAKATFQMPAGEVTFRGGFTSREVLLVKANSLQKVYDGQTHTVSGYTVYAEDGRTPISGITLMGLTPQSVTASRKDVGSDDLTIDLSQVTAVMEHGTDVTERYLLTKEDGTLTITKRPVKIWVDADVRDWGEPVTDQLQLEPSSGDRGIIAGDTIHLKNDVIQMLNTDPDSKAIFPEPGVYRPVVIPDDLRNGNYEVEVVDTENRITINPIPYTIQYFFQNETLDGYDEDTGREQTAYGYGTITPRPEDLLNTTGFTLVGSPSITLPDETVLELYFDRNIYSVKYLKGTNGELSGDTEYQVAYGLPVVSAARPVPAVTPDTDYYHTGWSPDPTTSTVTGNMEFTAQYVAAQYAGYVLEYYLQDVNDPQAYTMAHSVPRTGEVDTTVTVQPEDLTIALLTGFAENETHASRVISADVKADGTTKLRVYFDRESYTVTYVYAADSESTAATLPQAQTVKYGQTVTIAPNLTLGTHTFTGWRTDDKDQSGTTITGGAGATFAMPAGNVTFTGSFTERDVLHVKANSLETYYNGQTQTVSGYKLFGADGKEITNITLTGLTQQSVTASRRDAGSDTLAIDLSLVTGVMQGGVDVTERYLLTKEDGTLLVKPRPVQIWVDPDTRDWGEDDTVTLEVEERDGDRGLIPGDEIYLKEDIRLVNTNPDDPAKYPEPGVYKPVIVPDDAKNGNYVVEVIGDANTITVNPIAYRIEYYFQNLDLAGYTQDTGRTKVAQGYGTVRARPEDLAGIVGFTLNEAKSPAITLPGETVLRLYFDRNLYTIRYLAGSHGRLIGTTSYANVPYGAPVVTTGRPTPTVSADTGYHFSEWLPTLGSGSTVAGDMTYVAQYTVDANGSYRIEYYLQSADAGADDTYVRHDYVGQGVGQIGSQANVKPADLTLEMLRGFAHNPSHPQAVTQVRITEDGEAALKLYFNREVYQVSYAYAQDSLDKSAALPQAQQVKYGQQVTVADDLTHAAYTFTGWHTNAKDAQGSAVTGGAGTTFAMPMGNVVFEGAFTDKDVLTVRANSADVIYNGQPQSAAGYKVYRADGSEATGITLVGLAQDTVGRTETNAGTYDVAMTILTGVRVRENGAITDKYRLVAENGSLHIAPRPVNVHVRPAEKAYDGTGVENLLQIEANNPAQQRGLIPGDTIYLVDDVIRMINEDPASSAKYPEAGTYRPVIELDHARNSNYVVADTTDPLTRIVITDADYVIEYYFQNELLSGYDLKDTKIGRGSGRIVAGDEHTAGIVGYTLNRNAPGSVLEVYVTSGNRPVMKLYFDRNLYNIRYDAGAHGTVGGGSNTTYQIPYGLSMVTATTPVPVPVAAEGYHFVGWQPNPNLPAFSIVTQSRTFVAQYAAVGNAAYTIEYYLQDAENTASYALSFTKQGMGTAGSTVRVTDADLNLSELHGFTQTTHPNAVTSAVLSDDGTTVLRVYFNRDEYQVTYGYRTDSQGQNMALLPVTQTYRYGQQVTVAANIANGAFRFTGWQTDAKDAQGRAITGGAGAKFTMPAGNVAFTGAFVDEVVLLVRANSSEVYYNGEMQRVSGYTVLGENGQPQTNITLEGLTPASVVAEGRNAGTYDARIDLSKVTAILQNGIDVTEQYALASENGTLLIKPRPIQVWVDPDTRDWGSEVTDALQMQPRQGDAGLIPGDTIYLVDDTIRMVNTDPDSTATFPEPGTYRPVVIPDDTRNPNYAVEVIDTDNLIKIRPLSYRIEYYFMKDDMKTYAIDTLRTKQAEGFGTVSARPEDLTGIVGFTFNEAKSPAITLPGQNVLKLYFDRNVYTVRYLPGAHGSLTGETTYQVPYGQPLVTNARPVPEVTADEGYFHSSWTPELTAGLLVTGDMEITAHYSVKAGAGYRIEYYLQSVEDEDLYELSDYVVRRNGTVGEMASATAADMTIPQTTGFTYRANHPDTVSSVEITADGDAALKLYFTRNAYRVTYAYTAESQAKESALLPAAETVKYGQQVTIANDLTHAAYTFTGWHTDAKDMDGRAIQGGAGAAFLMPAGPVTILGGFTDKDVLTVRANSLEALYDGKAKTVSGYKVYRADGTEATGVTLSGLTQASIGRTETNAGVYDIPLSGNDNVKVRENGLTTDKYLLVFEGGTLEITPRPVYVWVKPVKKVYDGLGVSDLLQIEPEGTVRGLIPGDKIHLIDDVIEMRNTDGTVSVYPEPGTYEPIVRLDDGKNANYIVELINQDNRVVILPTDLDGDFVVDGEAEYDGKPHGVTLSDDTPEGDVYYLHDDGEWKPEPVEITDVDDGPKNVIVKVEMPNGNTTIAEGTITLRPRKIRVIAEDDTMVYTGNPYETTGERAYAHPADTIADYARVDAQTPLAEGQQLAGVTITSEGHESHDGARPVNVGTYAQNLKPGAVSFMKDDQAAVKASNYEIIGVTNGTLEITKRNREDIDFVGDNDPTYDGKDHGVLVDLDEVPDGDVTYSDDGGKTWKPTPPTITDVDEGPKDVWVKVETDNEVIIGKGTVDVQPREITLAAKDQEMTYTGSPYGGEGTKTFADGAKEGPAAAVTVGGTKGLAEGQKIGSVALESQPSEQANDEVPVGAGIYEGNLLPKGLVILGEGGKDVTANYRITDETAAKLTITKRNREDIDFVGDSGPTYDGEDHGVEVDLDKVPDGEVSYSDDGGKTWTKDPPTITDVNEGPKDVWVKVETDDEVIIGKGTVDVQPRRITVTANDDTMVFTGSPYGPKDYKAGTAQNPTGAMTVTGQDGLVSGQYVDSLTVTSQRYPNQSGSVPTKTGVYADNLLPGEIVLVDANGRDVTANYAITPIAGDLEITHKTTTYEPGDEDNFVTDHEGLYDGDEHGVIVDLTDVPDGDVSYSDDGGKTWKPTPPTITDVDEGPKEIWVKVENEDETVIGKGIVNLLPRAITITALDDSFIYNKRPYNTSGSKAYKVGTDALPRDGVQATGKDGLAKNEAIDSALVQSATPRPVNAGTYERNLVPSAAVIVAANGRDTTKNYTVTYANGTLEIEKRKVFLDFKDREKDKDYDGLTNTPLWQIVISGDGPNTGLISGDKIDYELDFNGTGTYPEVGDYDVTIEPDPTGNPNYDVQVTPDPATLIIYGRVQYNSGYPTGYPQNNPWPNVTYTDPTRYRRGETVTAIQLPALQSAMPTFQSTGLTLSAWNEQGTSRQPGSTFTMGEKGHDLTALWLRQQFTLTVQHRVEGNPSQAVALDEVLPMEYGQRYTVQAVQTAKYTPLTASVSGVMPDRDLTVTIYYTENGGGTPGGNRPNPNPNPGGTTINDNPTPAAANDNPLYTILDDDIPLGGVTSRNVGYCFE